MPSTKNLYGSRSLPSQTGLGKFPGGFSVSLVETFMKEACAGLDARPFVEKYTWKTRTTEDVNMGTSALFNDDGTLTALGQVYAAI